MKRHLASPQAVDSGPPVNPQRAQRRAWLRLFTLLAGLLAGVTRISAREFPPLVSPPKPFRLPGPAVRVLSNGLKVVVIERHSLPVVALRLVVKTGAEADPPDLPGTAQLVAALLSRGAGPRSAPEIAETIDSVGGEIETGADWDESFVTLTVLTDHTNLGFQLLADIAARPAFAPAEVERKRRETLSALELMRDDPEYLADTAYRTVVFTGTPYGHPPDGTVEAIRRITVRELREDHARYYRPENSVLAVVGDLETEDAFGRAERFFGSWSEGPAPPRPPPQRAITASRRVVVIDKPDAVQTEIRVGNLGISRDDPDYYPLTVANQILGGPATNRLFKALRSQKGLTYGASSDLVCHRSLGTWLVKTFTRTPETVKTVRMVLEEMDRLRDHPISEQELETAQSYLQGHLALEFESVEGIATELLDLMIHNLPLDYWDRFPEKIAAIKRDDVFGATRRYLDPEHNVIVLVGNASGFANDLKKLGPVRVIPLGSVDLASANLERTVGAAGDR